MRNLHGLLGIILVAFAWYLNWNLTGLRTHWGFFPLWLGYCLTIDSLVCLIKGNSLLTRNLKQYIALYFISIPGWWIFEAFNIRMQNWHYAGAKYFTDLQFFLLASLSFSTVMPAVFSTAELAAIFIKKSPGTISEQKVSNKKLVYFFLTGVLIIILILLFPHYFYFLIWIALFFLVDPVNVWLGNSSLLTQFYGKNYTTLLALAIGALICGFFWEMWNYYSYPKWEYYLPMVNFGHVFEMPILGYIGYVPFAFELYALYNLITRNKFPLRII
jgi:hypothetical protein